MQKQLIEKFSEVSEEIGELEEKLKLTDATETLPVSPGKKPTFEDSDHDEDVYEDVVREEEQVPPPLPEFPLLPE